MVAPDKQLIALRFRKSLDAYAEHAHIQRETAARLVRAVLSSGRRRFGRVFEFGCGRGLLTKALAERIDYDLLILNDLVDECDCLAREVARGTFLPGDVESIVLPENLDLVISGAVVQWLDDFPSLLEKLHLRMNSGAILAFSTFGPENLRETSALSGVGLTYPSLEELKGTVGTRFRIRLTEEAIRRLYFDHPLQVLEHLRSTGVAGLSGRTWTPSMLRRFCDEYDARFRDADGVRLTYHPVLVVADRG